MVELGLNIDETVRRIATSYNSRGLVERVTSYDAPAAGNVVNEVRRAYNDFNQLVTEYQAHGGAVNTSTTPKVEYAYADGSSNTTRPTTLTYPNGRTVTYATSGGDDERLSRVKEIKDGSTTLAEYTYLGLGGIVKTNYAEPGAACEFTFGGTGTDPFASCLDRFGRVIQIPWLKSGSPIAGGTYQYDRSSNRTQMQPLGYTATSALQRYSYDGVDRLTRLIRGATSEMQGQETWSLDATGNWRQYDVLDVDDASKNLAQTRQANRANEITDLARQYGANWPTPSYDRSGNTVTFPQPLAPTEGFAATYDAWNRLITLTKDGESDPTAVYAYDGLTRRITTTDASANVRHCY